MTVTYKAAKRQGLPLVVGVVGGTGGGKTMSALRVAKGIAGGERFAMLDTEAGRGLHYADQFDFDHAVLESPFRPSRYLEAIKAAEAAGYPVLVVDTMYHVWAGTGGVLDWHDQLMDGKESKKMTAWIQPKGEHRKMVDEITQMKKMHLVLTFRAQQKVEMVKVGGKFEVLPKKSLTGLDGWIPICESQFPHELTMSLLLTADAPGIPHPIKLEEQHRSLVPLNAPLTEATGAALARWAAGGDGPSNAEQKALLAEVSQIEEKVLAYAPTDEAREKTVALFKRQREHFAADVGAHIAWLNAQLENTERKVAEMQRDQEQVDFFTPAVPTTPQED